MTASAPHVVRIVIGSGVEGATAPLMVVKKRPPRRVANTKCLTPPFFLPGPAVALSTNQ